MNLFLQIWGGLFYLANKILLAVGEGRVNDRPLRIAGWICYLLGLPAWVIILVLERNWITAAVELASAPSMLFGLLVALRGVNAIQNTIWAKVAGWSVYVMLPLGVGYSLFDYGGIVNVTQLLEMSAMVGFVGGTYLLAKGNRTGWLLFMLMNGSVALLMYIQSNLILSAQQMVSLLFVIYGYTKSRNRQSSVGSELPSH